MQLETVKVQLEDRICKNKVTFRRGEMKETRQTTPASAKSLDTSPILRMFSSRSANENPRSLFNPWRTLSPSRTYAGTPLEIKYSSSFMAIVDLPAPERPVNQTVQPLNPPKLFRKYWLLEYSRFGHCYWHFIMIDILLIMRKSVPA